MSTRFGSQTRKLSEHQLNRARRDYKDIYVFSFPWYAPNCAPFVPRARTTKRHRWRHTVAFSCPAVSLGDTSDIVLRVLRICPTKCAHEYVYEEHQTENYGKPTASKQRVTKLLIFTHSSASLNLSNSLHSSYIITRPLSLRRASLPFLW